jgi:hypothetical protein
MVHFLETKLNGNAQEELELIRLEYFFSVGIRAS